MRFPAGTPLRRLFASKSWENILAWKGSGCGGCCGRPYNSVLVGSWTPLEFLLRRYLQWVHRCSCAVEPASPMGLGRKNNELENQRVQWRARSVRRELALLVKCISLCFSLRPSEPRPSNFISHLHHIATAAGLQALHCSVAGNLKKNTTHSLNPHAEELDSSSNLHGVICWKPLWAPGNLSVHRDI